MIYGSMSPITGYAEQPGPMDGSLNGAGLELVTK